MAIERGGVQFLGTSIVGVGPVREMTHVEANDGVTAIYGLNGSGKSSILRGIDAACRGVALPNGGVTDLHLRMDGDAHPESWFQLALTRTALDEELARMEAELRLDPDRVEEPDFADRSGGVWEIKEPLNNYLDLYFQTSEGGRCPDALKNTLRRAANKCALTLRAVGTPNEPRWDVYLSLPLAWSDPLSDSLRKVCTDLSPMRDSTDKKGRKFPVNTIASLAASVTGIPFTLKGLLPYIVPQAEHTAQSPILSNHWPHWLQLPLLRITSVTEPPASVIGREVSPESLNRTTRDFVSKRRNILENKATDDDSDDMIRNQIVTNLSNEASKLFASFIQDAPSLIFNYKTPDQWLNEDLPEWEYVESVDGRGSLLRTSRRPKFDGPDLRLGLLRQKSKKDLSFSLLTNLNEAFIRWQCGPLSMAFSMHRSTSRQQ